MRWSVVSVIGTRALLPASMATLPFSRPSVEVGPPLFCSGPMFSPPTPVAGTPVLSPAAVKLLLPTPPTAVPAALTVVEPMTLLPWSLNAPDTSGLVEVRIGQPLPSTNEAGLYGET